MTSLLIPETHMPIQNNSKILIFGGYGQLGSSCYYFFDRYYHNAIRLDSNYDITNYELVDSVFDFYRPDIVINCAAYTSVDGAELEKEKAMAINAHAVSNIAKLCYAYNCILIHISTDYIFSGSQTIPYIEHDQPDPINHYGYSKLMGEEAIINSQCYRYYILRTGWLYGAKWGLLANLIRQYLNGRREFSVACDIVGGPTYSQDLVWVLDALFRSYAPYGVYHAGSQGFCSWHTFITCAFNELNFEAALIPTPIADFKMMAKRPPFCALSGEKIGKANARTIMRDWHSSLLQYLSNEFLWTPSQHLLQA